MNITLDGKVAVITGASHGIGREIALTLAKAGADVVINYNSNAQAAREVEKEIRIMGGNAMAIQANVSDYEAAVLMMKNVKKEFGKIDILVNNAGISRDSLLMQMSSHDWSDVVNTNLTGVFNCSKSVIVGMMRQKSGKIVNISSVSGLRGVPGQINYSASKGGVNAFTRSLSREVAQFGITVNAICPGFITTKMTTDFSEKQKNQALELIPLKRFGTPEEVASSVLFIVSDYAHYITGQVISIDGGMST